MTAAPGTENTAGHSEPTTVSVDAAGLPATTATLGALARLRLAAGRTGYRVRLCGASPGLRMLVQLAGLGGEFEWETEEREEPGGVVE
ncbi:STAS domain-containing protein [Actinacidiphila cocklensis]|uniref:STAS domain-containing protein n=1 Tax=Actinacidiphila cocklensis TaxID=887465 RepID=A0A9W4GW34_9ACTN|nr:STAS domain-containing protein [Actinacidiphila cocklensis]CAG6397329.1 STAS domain-containing protein [Actinacidiphila cocklensis]